MSLPPRGTGLRTGTARTRGYPPLTEAERRIRHERIYTAGNQDLALILGIGALLVGGSLIALVIFS